LKKDSINIYNSQYRNLLYLNMNKFLLLILFVYLAASDTQKNNTDNKNPSQKNDNNKSNSTSAQRDNKKDPTKENQEKQRENRDPKRDNQEKQRENRDPKRDNEEKQRENRDPKSDSKDIIIKNYIKEVPVMIGSYPTVTDKHNTYTLAAFNGGQKLSKCSKYDLKCVISYLSQFVQPH